MKRQTLAPHLELADIERRYRQSSDPVARSQWQIIWLLAQGSTTQQVVQATSYSATWIATIAKRYNADGADGIGDRRHSNPGAASLLSAEHLAELDTALQQAAPDGGLWTGPKIAQWMSDKLGRTIHPQRGWEVLKKLGYRSYVPRPRHAKADTTAQETFPKKSFLRPYKHCRARIPKARASYGQWMNTVSASNRSSDGCGASAVSAQS